MLLFRPIKRNDYKDLYKLAEQTSVGLTTLPADTATLKEKIKFSLDSFAQKDLEAYYFFALEDPASKTVVGVSAIDNSVGASTPFYSYKYSHITRICHELDIRNEYKILYLVNDYEKKSELCTLYLSPSHRKNGNGLFLSLARLLFIAEFPNRFSDIIFAEMRGVNDDNGNSPFWSGLGQKFFDMEFAEADRLTATTNKQFIADLMPRNPIYVDLLPKKAQAVIGKTHQSTQAAMKILEREGFAWLGYIDIFDAGPTLEATAKNIRTIKQSRCVTVEEIKPIDPGHEYMISNRQIDFRVVKQTIEFISISTIRISPETAKALKIRRGDSVRIASFK